MKNFTAPLQSFSQHAPSCNYRMSMDSKGPITPSSQNKSCIHVIVDAFSHFVVTVPIKSNNAKTAVKTLLHDWIVKFGPPINLVTDRGSEYINTDMAHLCSLLGIRHSPRTPYSPKTMVHLFVCFYKTLPRIRHTNSFVHFAHNSPLLSALNVSPHQLVFHIRLRIPSTFDIIIVTKITHVYHNTAPNNQNTLIMTKRTSTHSFQNTLKTYSTMVSCS